jgi:hypothetical protein
MGAGPHDLLLTPNLLHRDQPRAPHQLRRTNDRLFIEIQRERGGATWLTVEHVRGPGTISVLTLKYRIVRHPIARALGARSHLRRRSCNILLCCL